MIRYRYAGLDLPIGQAAACTHPRLSSLAGCGPWAASAVDGFLVLDQVVDGWTAAGWLPWVERDGWAYQVAENLDLALLRRREIPHDAVWIRFARGELVPVAPAYAEGLDIDPSGKVLTSGPGSYLRALDAFADKGSKATFVDALPLMYEAIKSCHACPPELCHALHLITTADVPRVVQVAYGTVGKVDPASDGSSCASQESTGGAAQQPKKTG